MKIPDQKLKEILLEQNFVMEEDLSKGMAFAQEHGGTLLSYLYKEELLTKSLLGQAIAEHFGVPYIDLGLDPPLKDVVMQIPEDVAREFHVICARSTDDAVYVASMNPTDQAMQGRVTPLFVGKDVIFVFSLPEDIDAQFIHYQKPLQSRFVEIINKKKHVAPEILDEILSDSLAYKASDIHFEPQENDIVIRFRIDGVLMEAGRINKEYYDNLSNRIKVQSNLRIDEHNSCQDGAIRVKNERVNIDLRVSIIPTLNGEKICLRILAAYLKGYSVSDLGLSKHNERLILDSIQKPFGMILVTGATGSGKTTTLYSLLKILNKPDVNITTIEDPVEYKVGGINQIQVNVAADVTFANGLRSVARQDPDVILVGEIRDQETAEIAVNAALTGHLLLSTFHANDAATAIPRLLNFGIQPFLVASSMELVIAQKLVRTLCTSCRFSYAQNVNDIAHKIPHIDHYFQTEEVTMYKAKGCDNCNHTGFKGRTAIAEFIGISPEMKDLILKRPSMQQIWQLARSQGSRYIFEDGIDKVLAGVTSIDELIRIVPPPKAIW